MIRRQSSRSGGSWRISTTLPGKFRGPSVIWTSPRRRHHPRMTSMSRPWKTSRISRIRQLPTTSRRILPPTPRRRSTLDAAKPDVAHPGIDHLRSPRGRSVPHAVTVRAQEGPALDHLAGNLELRLVRVVTVGGAAGSGSQVLAVPVGGPFPHVA